MGCEWRIFRAGGETMSNTWDCQVCETTFWGGDAGPYACDCGAQLVERGGSGLQSGELFSVLLADCPWNYKTRGRSAANTPQTHYSTMTIQQLKELPVASVCDKNCALFFWVVDWMKPSDCQSVAEAWGFTYRTRAWTWIKSNPSGFGFFAGRGFYTQSNPEDCWLFVRGSMPVSAHDELSLIYSAVGDHSHKPDDQYRKIERLYPGRRYLELFSRRKGRPNWSYWGNEVESDVVIGGAA